MTKNRDCGSCKSVLCACQSEAMQTLAAENRELRRVVKHTLNKLLDLYGDIQNPKGADGNKMSKWVRKLAAEIRASLSLTQEGEGR